MQISYTILRLWVTPARSNFAIFFHAQNVSVDIQIHLACIKVSLGIFAVLFAELDNFISYEQTSILENISRTNRPRQYREHYDHLSLTSSLTCDSIQLDRQRQCISSSVDGSARRQAARPWILVCSSLLCGPHNLTR
jgi:hypothetical protein